MEIQKKDRGKLSPMMAQYLDLKKKYPDCVLFFRLGDFYEMFFDDAIRISRELELTLTGRDCGLEERAPMCGVPYHSVDLYLKRLVERGYKIAICEQLTDPATTKGLVERDVVRIVTPGTLIESDLLDEGTNNYLCSLYYEENGNCGLCFADLSTGEMTALQPEEKNFEANIIDALSRYMPAEIIMNDAALLLKDVTSFIKVRLQCVVTMRDAICFSAERNHDFVCQQFQVPALSYLCLPETGVETAAVYGMMDYIRETQKNQIARFISLSVKEEDAYLGLDFNARRNLELTETIRGNERKGSLLWLLNTAKTSMGKRMLKTWIEQPLMQPVRIMERLDAVEAFVKKSVVLMEVRSILDTVYDLERLMTRVLYKTATPRDLKALAATAKQIPPLKAELEKVADRKLIAKLLSQISDLSTIAELVDRAIVDNPPVSIRDGGIIQEGFHRELDGARCLIDGGNHVMEKIEQRERERTGIKGLKIGYNRVFGYYIEVTRSYYNMVPEGYIRKQTLANCERFITSELKQTENEILSAKEKALRLEEMLFIEVRDNLATQLKSVQETAAAVAQIDVLAAFANVAIENQYTKPEIAMDGVIQITGGRHPVVERMLTDTVFVPNDTYLDNKSNRMMLITGPNMAGKSTYMRQVALITLMAQIGSFVPADYAKISVVDKIFTRVGASDDLTAGQSTFMVEMHEVSDILKYATPNSLVILDEVGRGTSTLDGVSIARSVAEYICNSRQIGCKTLFATHYHELMDLEHTVDGIKNYSIAVKKHGDTIRFLRKIVPGGIDDSYGIEVAKLAGLPDKVVKRARAILKQMEQQAASQQEQPEETAEMQYSFAAVQEEKALQTLRKTNLEELSDAECRQVLEEITRMLQA
jgi:DNA mismatch repair protein MutS